jgi:hypothetical protein
VLVALGIHATPTRLIVNSAGFVADMRIGHDLPSASDFAQMCSRFTHGESKE